MKKCLGCGTNNRRSFNGEKVVVEFIGAYCSDCFNEPKVEPLDTKLVNEQIAVLIEQKRINKMMSDRLQRAEITRKKKQFEI